MTTLLYDLISVDRTPAGMAVSFSPVDGGELIPLLLSQEFWTPLGYRVGDRLTETDLQAVRQAEELSRAVSRTLRILAGSDHSRAALLRKLKLFGFEAAAAEGAADYAERQGYINEERQALRTAEYFIRHKFWGRKRIAAELFQRGYRKDAIRYATDHISSAMYMTALHALLDRKYTAAGSHEERERLYASLYRMGYSLSEINLAIKELDHEQ